MRRLAALAMHLGARLFRGWTFRIRSGLARGMRRRVGFGFRPRFGKPLDAEEQLLDGLELEGQVVYDVGGYVGMHTLFFARKVGSEGRVVAFEPNPVNLTELRSNVALNGLQNVTVIASAVSDEAGTLEFVYDPVLPARGTLVPEIQGRLASQRSTQVPVDSIDNLRAAHDLPAPDFVKIDVEGLEDQVLRGLAETLASARPTLFVELHGAPPPELIERLLALDYSLRHVEQDRPIAAGDAVPGGHLFARQPTAAGVASAQG